MSIGGLPALNDGNNARAELYNRLIDEYGVQLFISAGNSGPGLNTIGDPSVATDVVSVASSISKETWRANYGSEVSSHAEPAQLLLARSARGRRVQARPDRRPARRSRPCRCWLKQPDVAEAGYALPVGYAHVQRHLDGLPAGRGRRGAAAERRPPGRRGRHAGASCARRCTPRPTSSRASRPPARATGSSTSSAPGRSLHEGPRGSRDYTVVRAGLHADLRVPRDPRPRAPASTTGAPRARAARPRVEPKTYEVTVTRTSRPGPRRPAQR